VKFIVGENVAPWRSTTGDLRLEAAQIREIGHIRVCEVEGALDVTVDAFSDSRQIQVVPGCEVVAAAIVTVGGAGV
jgi:hypothetical protein